jgi:hypothetical protein
VAVGVAVVVVWAGLLAVVGLEEDAPTLVLPAPDEPPQPASAATSPTTTPPQPGDRIDRRPRICPNVRRADTGRRLRTLGVASLRPAKDALTGCLATLARTNLTPAPDDDVGVPSDAELAREEEKARAQAHERPS